MKKAQLRSAILGNKSKPAPKELELELNGEKLKIFVSVPTVKERDLILRRAGIKADKDGNVEVGDPSVMQAHAIVMLAVDEDGEAVFDQVDVEALRDLPAIGVFKDLAEASMEIFKSAVKEAGKT